MSVVVAIKEGNKIYMGCDSQVTHGGTRVTLKNKNNYKIWNVLGVDNCLMGHVGRVREANAVRLIDDMVPELTAIKDNVNYRFVVERVTSKIVSQLRRFGFCKDEQYFESTESEFLFAYKDKLYDISPDTCVIEVDDCVAIGSGEDQAIGSLVSTVGEDPIVRIIKAIKASAASDIYVDYPIILTDTETNEFTVITEKNEASFLSKKESNNKTSSRKEKK